MSGHSKWHNIQKTKGAQDAKRAAAFTKISKEMIVAVKEGGGIADPAYNSRLATVITKAKAANMPNDNIKRVLEKAAASGSGDNYETITYEGHGPCGIAVIVETMTDNRNRTAGSVRHHFDKYGGSLGTSGCVSCSEYAKFQELAVLPTPPLNDPHIIILAIHSPPLMLSFHNSLHSALPHILQ